MPSKRSYIDKVVQPIDHLHHASPKERSSKIQGHLKDDKEYIVAPQLT